MEKRFSFSLAQFILLLLLTVVIVVGLTIVVFIAGQRNALGLFAVRATPTPTSTATMPPLPKAMTATPVPGLSQTYILTEEQINAILVDLPAQGSPVVPREVRITPEQMLVTGDIDYSGFRGVLEISGAPYVQDRRLRFRLDRVTLDGQTLPALLYPTVEEQINLFFEDLLGGYDVESVQLEEGRIVATVVPW
jgi:hypothetical protein